MKTLSNPNFLSEYSTAPASATSYKSDFGAYFAQYSSSLKFFANAVIPEKKSIVVTSISPRELSCYGGEIVTLTGMNLINGTQKVTVKLQGVTCTILTKTATQITCLSGEKEFYNVLELTPTTLTVGNVNAVILAEVIVMFNFSDRVKFTYFDNEFVTYGNLYIPSMYGMTLNLADYSISNDITLNNIGIDGILILTTSID